MLGGHHVLTYVAGGSTDVCSWWIYWCLQGSMTGLFDLVGVQSGATMRVTVPPFALTPTASQFADAALMPPHLTMLLDSGLMPPMSPRIFHGTSG
jgi:hypothetical protein